MAVYTFDGNATETQNFGGVIYAKIATTAPDLHSVIRAVYVAPNGSTYEITSENMMINETQSDGAKWQAITASLMGKSARFIICDNTGLWVYNQPNYGYCSLVEFADTETESKISPGRKHLLYRMFRPIIARVLSK